MIIRWLCLSGLCCSLALAAEKSVWFVAGPKSHGPGQHDHPAGCALLAQSLQASGLAINAKVSHGWPTDETALIAADALVIYGDGLATHPADGHLDALRARYRAGKALVLIHFAIEPSNNEMADFFKQSIGGYFDPSWSVNPVWKLEQPNLTNHPIARGVQRFMLNDEYYYHIRLRDEVVPVMTAVPPESSLGADGPRSGNPSVRAELAAKKPQTIAWAVENPNKSRGFGFTGGHFLDNWNDQNYRKLVVNGIAWAAGVELPPAGVDSRADKVLVYQTIDAAIAAGALEDVKLRVSKDPSAANSGATPQSRTPLEQAILRNKTEIVVFLLEHGANANTVNTSKRTPLHLAVDRHNAEVVAALLKAGAKPNVRDQDGWTPLHHAAAKNQLATAKALLAGGADPMTLSDLGGTALHEAAASGGPEIIQLLLDHKVDPTIQSKQGVTAMDLAKQYHNQAAIDLLSSDRR